MHFHLPKPLHGWREFAGEVGIIVVGVLIALGAEQVVETIHQRAELRDAEDGMVAELRDDNLPQAYTRAALFNCYANQLDAIQQAIASGDRAKFAALAESYRPVKRTWDDEAWKAAMDSQVLVHSGAKRMADWSSAYVMIPFLGQVGFSETEQLPLLRAALSGTGSYSAEQQDRLFQVVSRLRAYNRGMSGASLVLMNMVGSVGLKLTQVQKAELLAEARKSYGSCVTEPAPDQIDVKSQIAVTNDAQLGRR